MPSGSSAGGDIEVVETAGETLSLLLLRRSAHTAPNVEALTLVINSPRSARNLVSQAIGIRGAVRDGHSGPLVGLEFEGEELVHAILRALAALAATSQVNVILVLTGEGSMATEGLKLLGRGEPVDEARLVSQKAAWSDQTRGSSVIVRLMFLSSRVLRMRCGC